MNEAADFLFRCNPVPGWIYDRETLCFLAVNQAAIARYGYSEDEFLGMTIADIRPAEDVPLVREVNERLIPGPQIAGRGRHTLKDGEIIIAEVHAFPVTFLERAAALVTARDITGMDRFERAEAEQLRKGRESSALLALAGRAAKFGGWRVDLLTEEVVWSNETAAIHELANEPITLAAGLEHYVPEHRPIIEASFRACAEDGVPYDLILQIVTGKGRTIWIRAIGEPERDADGRIVGVWGSFQDIDELVRAQVRTKTTQRRLAETLNSISEGFMVLDQEWRLTFLNRAGSESLMRSERDLVGKIIWDEFPEARDSQFEAGYRRAVQTGETVTFEEYFEPLQTWFEVRAHPTPEGLAVHFRDVTERRRSLEALRLSEERFRLLTVVTNDVIWDWNLVNDEIWWNEHMPLQFGHEPGVSGTRESWASHIHPEDRQRVLARIHAVIDGTGTEWSDEYRFLKADGSEARVIDRGLVIRDANGVGHRMLGSMTDVTARMAMEAQLREAQKLEAVGKLTGGIAHDFNNLLTVIIGTVESLAERLAHDPESVMLAETTAAAAQRGAELTSRLLAFARQQPLEPRTIDVARLVTDFDPILRRTLSGAVDLHVIRRGELWTGCVDRGQLETALLNLVINAGDAMPRGGRLTIEISNAVLDDDYARANDGVQAGDYVKITVSDSGSGMAPGVASRAFEPFFTTKEIGKGSGLGLSMVYGFIRQSRGHVKICSEPDKGTTVCLYLPRSHGPISSEPAASSVTTLAAGNERILVVEDDAMVREHVARQLDGLGYAVTVAFDGPQALAHLERGETFDLLLTDVVMPGGLNGRELAVAARRFSPDLKVLFTSGYTEDAIVHDGRLDSDVQLLSKPYRKRDLAGRVRGIFDH